jgi:hypothetical protein
MGLPSSTRQPESSYHRRFSSHRVYLEPVTLEPEFVGDAVRTQVVLERARHGRVGPEPGEGQLQNRRPHLGSDTLAVVGSAEPGSGEFGDGTTDVVFTDRDNPLGKESLSQPRIIPRTDSPCRELSAAAIDCRGLRDGEGVVT